MQFLSSPVWLFSSSLSRMRSLATAYRTSTMTFDYILGAAVTIFVLGYLVYALIRPERF